MEIQYLWTWTDHNGQRQSRYDRINGDDLEIIRGLRKRGCRFDLYRNNSTDNGGRYLATICDLISAGF